MEPCKTAHLREPSVSVPLCLPRTFPSELHLQLNLPAKVRITSQSYLQPRSKHHLVQFSGMVIIATQHTLAEVMLELRTARFFWVSRKLFSSGEPEVVLLGWAGSCSPQVSIMAPDKPALFQVCSSDRSPLVPLTVIFLLTILVPVISYQEPPTICQLFHQTKGKHKPFPSQNPSRNGKGNVQWCWVDRL